jgi:hypothetical protein
MQWTMQTSLGSNSSERSGLGITGFSSGEQDSKKGRGCQIGGWHVIFMDRKESHDILGYACHGQAIFMAGMGFYTGPRG